jgi:hypothetical protein
MRNIFELVTVTEDNDVIYKVLLKNFRVSVHA